MKDILKREERRLRQLTKLGYDIKRSREFIFKKAGLDHGSILEVGTGKGHFALLLANKGFVLTSIDLDPGAHRVAREFLKADRLQRKVRLKRMDAEKLDFPSRSFDQVVSVNFMHHAQYPKRCLAEMVRVARAKIVIADINKKGELVLERMHKKEGHDHPRSDISFQQMRSFLEEKGFSVRTFKGFCQTMLVAEKE
ncbi:MAG TPA: class I SAM-dependent methyltransferase [Candidatus Omnitrophota bacterium]|nr:class I SAM-dependent methyltransferase [Candidatus Omnitrophota bacterium]HSA31829.1 class I SAM-dependent methyltransferase [Candidatus Omnitrophota bacterium]